MKKAAILIAVLALGLVALALFQGGFSTVEVGKSLTVYCAAGLKKPVEAIAEDYRREYGVEVRLQYGGSGTLLSNIRVAGKGDLLIAADDGTLADARRLQIVREAVPLVQQHPVVAVRAGNPKAIKSVKDLLRDDVRVALANPDAASIGRKTRDVLGADYTKLAARAAVMKLTVAEVAVDLSLGAVDAAVVWDATVPQFKGIEAVAVPEFLGLAENASAAVLAACAQPAAALRFARYAAAAEKGGAVFAKSGFKAARADRWMEKPELILYSGGVNRLAIEKLVKEFADREGVTVTTVFNGCGILCSAMRTMGDSTNPKFPDAYYACDVCFVPPVAKHFPEAVMLTETDIMIAVPKGNKHNIRTLADLAQPGLKLGICNAEQSTLGYMTRAMLKQSGLWEAIYKNVAVQVPTADFLINQMRAGALDAAIVYDVNIRPQKAHLDAITIQHAGAKAVQPFSVRVDSQNRQLAGRLMAFFQAHPERFTNAGFRWRGNEPAVASDKLDIPPWLRQASQPPSNLVPN